jgi:hypothetical protein
VRAAAPALFAAAMIAFAACSRVGDGEGADTTGAGGPPPAGGGDTSNLAAPGSITPQPSAGDRVPPPPPGDRATPPRRPTERPSSTPPPPPAGQPGASLDTARGIVAVVGAIPITDVILRPSSGRPITLTGPLAREVAIASGADVWVRGRRVGSRTIEVATYAVRSVDGVPAITGTLTADGDRLVLVTDDGRRHPIARPPAPLREHVGARVWITGDPSAAISYGVLRPRR